MIAVHWQHCQMYDVLVFLVFFRHGSTDCTDSELRLLREALGYATDAINSDPTPSQFCVQLIGRLLPYIQHSVQLERYLMTMKSHQY